MTIDPGQHSQAVFRFALSLTGDYSLAEDLMQETMLRGFQNQSKMSEVENPRAWLLTVAINLWRDHCRKQKRRPMPVPLHLMEVVATAQQEEEVESREHLETVLASFQELPDRQREVLYLRAVEEFTVSEIAAMLETSENNVKATLSIARKRLRKRFATERSENIIS